MPFHIGVAFLFDPSWGRRFLGLACFYKHTTPAGVEHFVELARSLYLAKND